MWGSPARRLLLRSLLGAPAIPTGLRQSIRPSAHLSSSSSPPSGGGGGGESAESVDDGDFMTFSEAKKLMRLVNVEALKRKLGMEGEEVIGYSQLLEACEGMGVTRSREEASAFARVLDEAGVVLLFRDKVYLHPDKHGTGRYCNDYSARASDIKSRRPVRSGIVQDREGIQHGSKGMMPSKKDSQEVEKDSQEVDQNVKGVCKQRVGENISAAEKRKFLVNTLFDLKDSKEVVYGTLDAWVAWEQKFPLVALKRALLVLEKEHQWHRIVQVLKWMLSKGQGTTMGTYEQLIQALEKDNRAEEAHKIWVKKISNDLHSVPWRVCDLMISIYYRNNMLDRLVKLFKGLEMYDRKPLRKSIVQKVADAYEMLGSLEEKSRIMEKYSSLFSEPREGGFMKSRKVSPKIEKESVCCLVSDKKEVVSNNE